MGQCCSGRIAIKNFLDFGHYNVLWGYSMYVWNAMDKSIKTGATFASCWLSIIIRSAVQCLAVKSTVECYGTAATVSCSEIYCFSWYFGGVVTK